MKTTIKQIMSKNIYSISPADSAVRAAQLMDQHDVGSVPVVSEGTLKGILTDRDIVIRCVAKNMNPDLVKASEIMTSRIAYISENQPVSDAVSMMASEQIRRLPVVEDGQLVGMVSFADIARRDTSPEIAEAISEISSSDLAELDFVRQYNPHA